MSAAPTNAPAAPRRALLRGNAGFRNLWCANLVSVFGDGLYFIALPWITYAHTHSGIATALTFVAGTLPYLLFGLIAGVFVDRWDRRSTLVVADLARAATLLVGAFVLLGGFNLAAVLAIAFCLPSFSRFFVPAQRATAPLLVDAADLLPANALMEGANNVGWIAGPALGGLLVAAFGGVPLLLIDALTFCASAAFLSRISFPLVGRAAAATGSIRQELTDGVRIVWRTPTLRAICSQAPIGNGCFAAAAVGIPLWIARSAHAGSAAYGAMMAALFVGSFVGSLLLVRYGQRVSRARLVVGGIFVMGVTIVAFGLAHSLVAGALALGGLGAALAAYNIGVLTLLQAASPPAQQGRVFSINEFCSWSLRPAVSLLIGVAADGWSINGVVVVLGAVMLCLGTVMVASHALRESAPEPIARRATVTA
jgi:MFS family permease